MFFKNFSASLQVQLKIIENNDLHFHNADENF
jgi:hypothetical protein